MKDLSTVSRYKANHKIMFGAFPSLVICSARFGDKEVSTQGKCWFERKISRRLQWMNFNPILFMHLLSCLVSGAGKQKLYIFMTIISFADLRSSSHDLLNYSHVHMLKQRYIVLLIRKFIVVQSFLSRFVQTYVVPWTRLEHAENYVHINEGCEELKCQLKLKLRIAVHKNS